MAKKKSLAPSFEQVQQFCIEKGFEHLAKTIFDYYEQAKVGGVWYDSNGRPVINYKQKLIGVWFKESNTPKNSLTKIGKVDALMNSSRQADLYLDQMFPNE